MHVNSGEGRHTRLGNCLSCARRPLPHIYRWEWRGGSQGALGLGRHPLGALPPFPCIQKGEGKRGDVEGRANPIPSLSFPPPLSFSSLGWPIWGAHQPLVAGAFSLLAHKAHIFCRGCSETVPVTRYVPGTLWKTSDVRILSCYISIFTSRPFQDSSSCL